MTTTRIILIDISSSMNSSFQREGRVRRATRFSDYNHKFEAAKQYLLNTVADLHSNSPSSSLIIISFAEDSSVIYQGNISNLEVINSAVNRLKPDGESTNLAAAFDLVFKILSQSTMPKIRYLEVITDGLSNQGDPVLSARCLQEQKGVFLYLYLLNNTNEAYNIASQIIGDNGGRIKIIEDGRDFSETVANYGNSRIIPDSRVDYYGKVNSVGSLPLVERTKFSIVYPEQISNNKWHSLYFFMYSQNLSEIVKIKINKLTKGIKDSSGSDYESISLKLLNLIPEGSLVEVSFFSEAVQVNPEKISFKWFEDLHEFHFRIKCQASEENLNLVDDVELRIDISVNALPVNSIPLVIAIGDTQNSKISTIDLGLVETIFASYSEEDYEVVEDFKEKYEVIGISMFTQAISYRNAEVRGKKLQKLFRIIESSDIFQLFWSSSAQQCEGVKIEMEKAIELIQDGKKHNFFRGVYWEEQFPELPPGMVGMPFSKLPRLRAHRKEKANLEKAIEREAARPIANITTTAIAESTSAPDSFHIDQRHAVHPSTAIAKDQAKQQVNISSVTSEPQCTPEQILVQNLLEKLRQFIKFNPNLSDDLKKKGLEQREILVDISKKPIDSDIQNLAINKAFTILKDIIYSGSSVDAGLKLITEIATLFDIK